MPGVVQRGGRGRRSMNEINMVPFIDVMLVLLINFMVSAPLMTPGVVEVIVGSDDRLRLRVDQGEPESVGLKDLAPRVRGKQAGNADTPVVISADKAVRYESVVKVMDALQRAGIKRVGLSVKQGGNGA